VLAIGLPAAFVIAKLFNSILYGIKPNDAVTFISIPLFLAFVALLASYIPARRATKLVVCPLYSFTDQPPPSFFPWAGWIRV
jgi:ABC-type lipoprotein release transport system permease subunit